MSARVVLICGLISIAITASAQGPPPPPPPPPPSPPQVARDISIVPDGRASLSGVVLTDEATPRPVRHALVRLGGDQGGGRLAVADDDGRFAFESLGAGRYTLTATRTGFVGIAYGARRPDRPGSAITIADGQRVADITVRMLRGAAISGMVRDEAGEPVPGHAVSLMRYGFNAQTGERTLQAVRGPFGVTTDDRGMYRVFGLAPGSYIILSAPVFAGRSSSDAHQVTPADVSWAAREIQSAGRTATAPPAAAPNVTYAPVFYPGTTSESNAAPIAVTAGEERTGIDLALMLVPTSTISGTVTADGTASPYVQVSLLAHERIEGLPFSGFSTTPPVRGAFTFTGVTPGRYTITARPSNPPPGASRDAIEPLTPEALAQYGLAEVTVNGQDVQADVRLQAGVSVSGRLLFTGAAGPPGDLTQVRVSLSAVVGRGGAAIGVRPATVDASGAFRFEGVAPGRYRVSASVPGSTATRGWALRSAVIDGQDTLDTAFAVESTAVRDLTVTFTDRPAELDGRMLDAGNRPAPEYFVIVFASDSAFWTPQSRRIQAKRPSSDGRFNFRNLPPGNYNVGAVTDVEPGEWFDPSFLAQLAQASIRIELAEGETKVQDVRVAVSQ